MNLSLNIFGLGYFTTTCVLIVLFLVVWRYYWRMKNWHMIELAEKIPCPKPLPLVGHAFHYGLGKSASEMFDEFMNKADGEFAHTSVGCAWFGPKLIIFIKDPKDIEIILSSSKHIDKSIEYSFFKPWFGNGLLISTGEKWLAHRKLIAPTFHLNILKSFIDLFNVNSIQLVDRLNEIKGTEFDCHDYLSEATVEILAETVMGVSKKKLSISGCSYAWAVMKMCNILHLRHVLGWLRPDCIFNLTQYKDRHDEFLNTINIFGRSVIKQKKEAFANGIRGSVAEVPEEYKQKPIDLNNNDSDLSEPAVKGLSYGQSAGLKDDLDFDDDVGEKKRLAFLDQLIDEAQRGGVVNNQEVRDQVNTIMFEGHDTTAAGSSFFLSMMGIHQEIQDRVIEELDEIFGDSNRYATFEDTLKMKYLERCLMETLRLYPPVPLIARELKTDVKMASGDYVLPGGCTVVIGIVKTHRMPEIYPIPDKFDPDNFLPDRSAQRHYYSFIPFSAGPRSCVGRKYAILKLKILLSTILRNFRVYSDYTEKDFKLQVDIILKRAEGFKIRLEPRKKMPL